MIQSLFNKTTFLILSGGVEADVQVLQLHSEHAHFFADHTVPNDSFGFWADLHLDGHV